MDDTKFIEHVVENLGPGDVLCLLSKSKKQRLSIERNSNGTYLMNYEDKRRAFSRESDVMIFNNYQSNVVNFFINNSIN